MSGVTLRNMVHLLSHLMSLETSLRLVLPNYLRVRAQGLAAGHPYLHPRSVAQ